MGEVLYVRRTGVGGGVGDGGANHLRSTYKIKTKPGTTRTEVLASEMFPKHGAPHPENPAAVCVSTDAQEIPGAPGMWEGEAEWQSNPVSGRDPADDQKQPDERRPNWTSQFIAVPCARFHDLAGVLFADTAGTPFDPAPDIPIICEQISVTRYEAACNRAFHRTFMNASNSDSWLGAEPGTAIFEDIGVTDEYLQGAWWVQTSYRAIIKPRYTVPGKAIDQSDAYIGGWRPDYVLNAGPRVLEKKSDDSEDLVPREPRNKLYDGKPVLLDAQGKELARNNLGQYTPSQMIYLTFITKNQVAFADLNLVPPPNWSYASE